MGAAALVCSVLANLKRDPDQREEPFTPADFMPGGRERKSERDEMIEFAEAVARGEDFGSPDPRQVAVFRKTLEKSFSNVG